MTRTEYLTDILLAHLDTTEWPDPYYRPFIEFRFGVGWYLVFPEGRYIGDDGEPLGQDWRQAERTLARLNFNFHINTIRGIKVFGMC